MPCLPPRARLAVSQRCMDCIRAKDEILRKPGCFWLGSNARRLVPQYAINGRSNDCKGKLGLISVSALGDHKYIAQRKGIMERERFIVHSLN